MREVKFYDKIFLKLFKAIGANGTIVVLCPPNISSVPQNSPINDTILIGLSSIKVLAQDQNTLRVPENLFGFYLESDTYFI